MLSFLHGEESAFDHLSISKVVDIKCRSSLSARMRKPSMPTSGEDPEIKKSLGS